MTPLVVPFAVQFVLGVLAFVMSARIARASRSVWVTTCVAAVGALMCWPLMRVFPVVFIDALSAPVVACVELTGIAIPAVLLFGVASRQLPKQSDQRAVRWLTAVAAVYVVKAGWWMISPGVGNLGPTKIGSHGVCLQTTGYTCGAASMVTMLLAHGIAADEKEMADLANTQMNGGTTDSRTLWALDRKLAGTDLAARYLRLDREGIIAAAKPCLVQLDWGFFISHLVPVMSANADDVLIGDPLKGQRRMSMRDFMREWKRTAIVLEQKQ